MPDVTNQATLQRLIAGERSALEELEAAELEARAMIEGAHAEAAERLATAQREAEVEAQHLLDAVRERGEAAAVDALAATQRRVADMRGRADATFERAVRGVVAWVTLEDSDV
jgi:vacuolar-type H+-ATPase subunit H